LTPFEFGDEEDFAAFADRLEIGGFVDGAVDGDGGFFFEMFAEAGVEAVHFLDDAAQVPGLDREFACSRVTSGEELEHRQNGRHLGETDPDDPFDELSLRLRHLASQIGDVGFRRDIRQVNIDGLLDGGCESFRLGVGEAGGCETLDCLVRIEGANHVSLSEGRTPYPPSSLGMKKISHPSRIGWK
jgi:hypothetical protein